MGRVIFLLRMHAHLPSDTRTHTHTHTRTRSRWSSTYTDPCMCTSRSVFRISCGFLSLRHFFDNQISMRRTQTMNVFSIRICSCSMSVTRICTRLSQYPKKKHTAILSLFSIIPTVLCMYLTVRRQMWYRQAKAASIMSSKAKR